ncbi:MAG: hypothetical protein AMXMBFR56_74690 [Polyangiaceae bacterium]
MKTADPLTQSLAPIALGLLLPLGLLAHSGCTKKDEPPPPLPSAAPVATPAAPLVLEVEDAGEDVSDADADAKKVGGGSSASMKKCCQAVSQNAESAPEPTKTYMKQLAAACFAAAGSGQGWSGGGFSCK